MSPEIGKALFGQAILGEYFRTFMVYGIIGMALGLYVWKANRASKLTIDPDALSESTGRSAWITIPTPPDSSSSSGTRTN